MKKLLLSLGSMAAIIAPVASVVACSDDAAKVSSDMTLKYDGKDYPSIKDFGHTIFKDAPRHLTVGKVIGVGEKSKPVTQDFIDAVGAVGYATGQTHFFEALADFVGSTADIKTKLMTSVKAAIAPSPHDQA